MEKNIVLDFSTSKSVGNVIAHEPLAIMPSELARKLLRIYAESLGETSAYKIIERHIEKLEECKHGAGNITKALEVSLNWVRERELIQNIQNENWDAYSTVEMSTNPAPKPAQTSVLVQ